MYSISVNESNQAAGFPRPQNGFLTVTCIDPTTNSTPIAITYTILDGSLPFGIGDSSGALSVTQDLDYDTPPRSYEFNVSCYNGSSPELNSTALMRITLYPVNDNIPVLSRNSFQVLITEVTPAGTVLASTQPGAIQSYSVTDADFGEGGDVVFTLSESSEDPEFFTLDMDNGNLVLSQTIDIDSTNRTIIGGFIRFSTRITVCDTNPPSEQCPNLLVEVLELPVNDHLPQFSNDSYFASFPETTLTGTVLVVATCTDGDRPGTTGSFSGITLSNPAQNVIDHFMVDNAAGSISLIQELDYEMDQMFNFTVVCSDTGAQTTSAQVIIDVIPENDNFPLFTNSTMGTFSYNFSLSRTAPIGFVVGQVTATDADVGTTTEITYGIEPNEYFNIDNTTGVITLSNSVVNSTDDILTINVTVSDGTLSSSALVSVELTSGNFDQPEFQRDNITLQINELTPVGTIIESFLCTDADMGSNAEISYLINSVSGLFQINSTSGALMVAMPLLLTDNDSAIVTYTLNISCEDNGIPVFSDSTLSFVQVYKDDSNPPIINNSNTEVYANEDAPTGEVIVIITATDADTAELSFSLVNASVLGTFIINSTTGVVMLNSNLDRELISEYQFTVVVTEIREVPGIPQSDSVEITVIIVDVNDNSPQFNASNQAVQINDLTPNGTNIASVFCTDSDNGTNAEISYSILPSAGVPVGLFGVSREGNVSVLGELRLSDFVLSAEYNLTIQCSDRGQPSLNDTALVTIYVDKVDFEPPVINNTVFTTQVLENAVVGSAVYTVDAYDVDSPAIEITLQNETSPGAFIINNPNRIVLNVSLDRETQDMYNVTVVVMEVRDILAGEQSTTALVTIEVEDVNDNTPAFVNPNPNERLNDGLTNGTTVVTVVCTDQDEGANAEILYSFVGNSTDIFTIDQNTGAVRTASSLTLLEDIFTADYSLNICCKDRGLPSLANETTLSIQVYKNDISPPRFANRSIIAYISENATLGQVVATISATDIDSPDLFYRLTNEGVFTINSSTGVITVAQSLDRENIERYEQAVIVTEIRIAPGLPQSATADLTILIRDVNDNAPQCQNTTDALSATITFGTYDSVLLLSLSCSDSDVGNNQVLSYSFVQSTLPMLDRGRFELNQMNGQLRFEGTLIHTATYIILILISDSGIPQQSSQVSVKIQVVPGSFIPFEVELYIIIVPILVGLILLILFLIVCIVCCVCCNRERVKRKQNYLLR